MTALTLSILLILIAVVLASPRRWALLGMVAGVLYLTQNVAIELAGFNMFPIRFLEIAGFIRVMVRREFSLSNLNKMDRLLLLFYGYMTSVFLLRSNEGQAYQIGLAVDAVFCYITFRGLLEDMEELRFFLRRFVLLLVPYVVLLFIESHTSQNPFSALGGHIVETLREGKPRCTGSFREYSLLGSLGASFLPLYCGLSFVKSDRKYAIAGILLSLSIVFFSNSGGPVAVVCFVILGWLLWRFRDRMSLVRRAGLAATIAVALVMRAPIWYLPTHFSFGGDAWHRSFLIQTTINHLGEWWFWGMSLSKTSHWFEYSLAINGTADITNQFIAFGLDAGLMAIFLFVWILVRAFKNLGSKLAEVRLASPQSCEAEYLLWGLGVMLLGHIANFISITYFDQFYVIWFLQLAFISSITHGCWPVPVTAISAGPRPISFRNDRTCALGH